MQKEQILVRDRQRIFLKMFRRRFKEKFDFSEDTASKKNNVKVFDRVVYVIYDKLEVLDFLKESSKNKNVLVCLFNKQFYKSLSFLEEINSLILFDESKTRCEILKELESHFERKINITSEKENDPVTNSNLMQTQFHDYYKALFFLM